MLADHHFMTKKQAAEEEAFQTVKQVAATSIVLYLCKYKACLEWICELVGGLEDGWLIRLRSGMI